MSEEVWILGKNKSIETFPIEFFYDKFTIGMNNIAIVYKTKFAVSTYPMHIKEFIKFGFQTKDIIGIKPDIPRDPKYRGDEHPNYFPGLEKYINWKTHSTPDISQIENDVKQAILKNKEYLYGHYQTVLHSIIYWCVINDNVPINLAGCNQDFNCASTCIDSKCYRLNSKEFKFCVNKTVWEDSKKYTREIIRCLNLHGDYIRLYEDYNDFLNRNKYE